MFGNLKVSRGQIRLALLLLGIVGLAVSAFVFYLCTPSKKQVAIDTKNSAQVTTVSVSDYNAPTDNVVKTEIPEAEAAALTVQIPDADLNGKNTELRYKVRQRSRANSHKQIAAKLPFEPVVTPGNPDFQNPMGRGQVEMWSGTRRAVISVPKAIKNDTFGEY